MAQEISPERCRRHVLHPIRLTHKSLDTGSGSRHVVLERSRLLQPTAFDRLAVSQNAGQQKIGDGEEQEMQEIGDNFPRACAALGGAEDAL